jgi:hypothetical protein
LFYVFVSWMAVAGTGPARSIELARDRLAAPHRLRRGSRRDLAPLANLELFSVAPQLTAKMYRELGKNAARQAKGMAPVPILTGGTDESISASYHARAVALVALEREACEPGEEPITVERA